MKITTRDARLLTFGFVIGTIVTLSLATITSPPPVNNPPALSIVATRPVIKSPSLRLPFTMLTNNQWQTRPVGIIRHTQSPDRLDLESSLDAPFRPNVDLISRRYQPDIKLDNLK
jgi:hypothetical protein